MSCVQGDPTFHRHGSSSRDPTQPQFICTSCHKYIKAHPMYQLLQCTATFDEQSSQSPHNVELSNTLEDSNTANSVPTQLSTVTEDSQPLIIQLQKTAEYLTAELSKAHEAIQKLQNQITTMYTQSPQAHQQASSDEFPTIPESSQRIGFPDAPWHNKAKLDSLKQSMPRQRELRRVQREAAAARVFQPPSPNQGFKYLYIPTKARIPIGTLRTTFRRLGVNNARLLDIHYPARHTATILIHNDYENEFIELLTKHRITPKENFNPNSGSILEDPNLASLSTTECDKIAKEHQITRLERAVQHIRAPVKYAVARFFYDKQWISKKFYDTLASARNPHLSNIFDQSPASDEDTSNAHDSDDINMITDEEPVQPDDRASLSLRN